MSEFGGKLHLEPVVAAERIEGNNWHRTVDMPLDEMSSHPSLAGYGSLQVDQAIAPKMSQISPLQCLLEQVKRDLIGSMRRHGEAAAVDCNAVSGSHCFGEARGRDLELVPAFGDPDPEHAGGCFDQAGKHQAER